MSRRRAGPLMILAVVGSLFMLQSIDRLNSVIWPRLPFDLSGSDEAHPIAHLRSRAVQSFDSVRRRQSKTLSEAVAEYERRYNSLPPPPNFDKWYEFATKRKTPLIDEFDSLFDSLLPFWSLAPGEIRARALEALGFDNALMGASIVDGKVQMTGAGQGEFQAAATAEMISAFAEWLPDMDVAFNRLHENRVLIPHEDLDRLLLRARQNIQSVEKARDPRCANQFSPPPEYLKPGSEYKKVFETRFTGFGHQSTWVHARMSCPPDTPARSLDDNTPDDTAAFSFGSLGFVSNVTSFSDVCQRPSLRHSIGMLSHPNAFSLTHELVPIFSPSKISSFHDILYPSPRYYGQMTEWFETTAVKWEDKLAKIWWRGSTSGGYSQGGSWRQLLRPAVVELLQDPPRVQVLQREKKGLKGGYKWVAKNGSRGYFQDRFDAQFTDIKQCEEVDCQEMREFFDVHKHVPQAEAWKHRYLLDMDGSALSGRFYAFLRSKSMPLKLTYFREWHADRLFPWIHYVPVSATTTEYPELLRYFEDEAEGRKTARSIAADGQEWVAGGLRREDMEVYMFRLLLEYGRLVDDNRQQLGWMAVDPKKQRPGMDSCPMHSRSLPKSAPTIA